MGLGPMLGCRFGGRLGPILLVGLLASRAIAGESWPVDVWPDQSLDFTKPSEAADYQPLAPRGKPWRICASYPHLKDSYWLSVNYGMVEQAKRIGIALRVVEAGGYPNLERQIAQVKQCAKDRRCADRRHRLL